LEAVLWASNKKIPNDIFSMELDSWR